MQITIRRAATDDAAALSALCVDVQQVHAIAHPEFFKQPAGPDFARAFMAERLDDPDVRIFIAEHDGEPVGYALGQIVDLEENPFRHAVRQLVIDQMSVRPAYRGRGIGTRLLEEMFATAGAEEIKLLTLSVWRFNEGARALYKRHGFAVYLERLWLTR